MTYTGDVQVGGPADERELPGLTITKLAVGPMDNNAYLLRCRETGEALLVDAANEAGRLLELVGDAPLATVVTTHQHAGPLAGAGRGGRPPPAPGPWPTRWTPAACRCRSTRRSSTATRSPVGAVHADGRSTCAGTRPARSRCATTTRDGRDPPVHRRLALPRRPGQHREGPAALRLADGRPGGARLRRAARDDTWVYPGHGKDTTLGAERPSLPEWRARGW